jgi:hypothetical protein
MGCCTSVDADSTNNGNNNNMEITSEQQIVVSKIFDDSTSLSDLKSNESFRTKKVLQEITSNKTKVTSPLIAAKVGWFFREFAMTANGREMASTNEVYDVIIINHCAKHATTPESVQHVAPGDHKHLLRQPLRTASLLFAGNRRCPDERLAEIRHDGAECSICRPRHRQNHGQEPRRTALLLHAGNRRCASQRSSTICLDVGKY